MTANAPPEAEIELVLDDPEPVVEYCLDPLAPAKPFVPLERPEPEPPTPLGTLYARRFGRFFGGIGEGFLPLGRFLKRFALGFVCDHDFASVSSARNRRVCRCGATRRI